MHVTYGSHPACFIDILLLYFVHPLWNNSYFSNLSSIENVLSVSLVSVRVWTSDNTGELHLFLISEMSIFFLRGQTKSGGGNWSIWSFIFTELSLHCFNLNWTNFTTHNAKIKSSLFILYRLQVFFDVPINFVIKLYRYTNNRIFRDKII